MADTPADEPTAPNDEGGDDDAGHDVPSDLSELHEILEAGAAGL